MIYLVSIRFLSVTATQKRNKTERRIVKVFYALSNGSQGPQLCLGGAGPCKGDRGPHGPDAASFVGKAHRQRSLAMVGHCRLLLGMALQAFHAKRLKTHRLNRNN